MNVNSVNLNDMSLLTDADIIGLIKSLNLELDKRDAAKRDEAIAAFQQAYYDLMDLGITPMYQDNAWDDGINLRDWDCFYF